MLRTVDLEYELPARLIATRAAEPRDSARLLVARRAAPGLTHTHVRNIGQHLRSGDLLVLNTTRVLPARFVGVREDTGAGAQGLFVREADPKMVQWDTRRAADSPGLFWHVLLKLRRFRAGTRVVLLLPDGQDSGVRLRLVQRASDAASDTGTESLDPEPEAAGWIVRVEDAAGEGIVESTAMVLERAGRTPLPPYIVSARKHEPVAADGASAADDAADRERYQTVYADPEQAGSVAAPTAGLHFTPGLLHQLRSAGVSTAEVVLHVGLGTFKPVEVDTVEEHPMHSEWCRLPIETARRIVAAREGGGRVIAVGTTAARTLESFPAAADLSTSVEASTRLLITPGYRFRNVDGLLTNFHLPRSTLMAMVGALMETGEARGIDRLRAIYAEAIAAEYRFYSFGDAMLVLP